LSNCIAFIIGCVARPEAIISGHMDALWNGQGNHAPFPSALCCAASPANAKCGAVCPGFRHSASKTRVNALVA